MKKTILVIVISIVLSALYIGGVVYSATVLYPVGGGTGTSTAPSYGKMLVGNAGGTYTLTATSSLGIVGGSYTATYPLLLTGSAFSTLFSTTTANTFSALNIFGNASSTLLSVGTKLWLGTATTTGVNGIDISAGCFAINGTCVGGSTYTTFGTDFYTYFHATTTDALTQGSTNKYWSNTLFDNRLSASSSISGITTLPNLFLPYGQTNFGTGFYFYFSATNTAALAEGTNLYYTDARVNTYIHASTTIPKLYTANTFTGLNIFGNATSTLFSSTYASSTLWHGGELQTCDAVTGKLTWANGRFGCGTDYNTGGTGSFPAQLGQIGDVSTTTLNYGHLLMWNGSVWQDTATSSLGISGGGTLTIETPVGDIDGNNKVFTTTNNPVTVFLNGAYQTPDEDYTLSGTYTITFVNAPLSGSNLRTLYGGSSGGGGDLTGQTLNQGNFIVGDDANLSQATTSIFIDSLGKLGIGTSSPSAVLSVQPPLMVYSIASTSVWRTPGTYSWTAPAGTAYVIIQAWGAGGAGAYYTSLLSLAGGGAGAFIGSTTVNMSSGQVVNLIVGQGGQGSTGGTGYGAGGNGVAAFAGGGGGSSAFGVLVIASGGGGGSASNPSGVSGGGYGATGSSGGAGGTTALDTYGGGGGGSATAGASATNGTGGAGGTGANTQTGTNGDGAGVVLSGGAGGGSSAGLSGNGNSGSGETGGTGSGGASPGADGTGSDSGGGGNGGNSSQTGGTPGAGGGGGKGTVNGGNGEIRITVYTSSIPVADIAIFSGFPGGSFKTFLKIDSVGHIVTGGLSPTCGTGCSSVMGDDTNMRITTGSSVSSITVNFSIAYTYTPICIANEESGGVIATNASSTIRTVTVNTASAVTGVKIAVHCEVSSNFTY